MVTAINRRMHIGFPTVYAFLAGKPNHYCSHEFTSWSIQELWKAFTAGTLEYWTSDSLDSAMKDDIRNVPYYPEITWRIPLIHSAEKRTHTEYDYDYRPDIMVSFPLYFFL